MKQESKKRTRMEKEKNLEKLDSIFLGERLNLCQQVKNDGFYGSLSALTQRLHRRERQRERESFNQVVFQFR